MDVLRPPIIRIGNRFYRKNPIVQNEGRTAEAEELTDYTLWKDESCDADFSIEETESGFKTKMDIPSAYFKFIIGKKGEKMKRIENETRTQLRIPKTGEGEIAILGHNKSSISSARTRIEMLVDSARQKQPFTHFLSIPLTHKQLQEKVLEFKTDVLRECDGSQGLDCTIFQNPCKLHLTIGTLVLLNKTEIQKALDVFNQCKEDLFQAILKGKPLIGHFKGLEYMNDDPSAVDVLYIKLENSDSTDKLQILCDQLVEKFTATGLMLKDYDRVKLHATIMNTVFRKNPNSGLEVRGLNRKGLPRESFNACSVLKNFANYEFGKYHIKTLHLSQRYSTAADGYYTCTGQIDFS